MSAATGMLIGRSSMKRKSQKALKRELQNSAAKLRSAEPKLERIVSGWLNLQGSGQSAPSVRILLLEAAELMEIAANRLDSDALLTDVEAEIT